MKKYLNILGITCLIQGMCVGFSVLFHTMGDNWDGISTLLFFGAFPASVVTDLILSLRGEKKPGETFSCIFLMPTNYTWLAFLLWGSRLVERCLQILKSLPADFG